MCHKGLTYGVQLRICEMLEILLPTAFTNHTPSFYSWKRKQKTSNFPQIFGCHAQHGYLHLPLKRQPWGMCVYQHCAGCQHPVGLPRKRLLCTWAPPWIPTWHPSSYWHYLVGKISWTQRRGGICLEWNPDTQDTFTFKGKQRLLNWVAAIDAGNPNSVQRAKDRSD